MINPAELILSKPSSKYQVHTHTGSSHCMCACCTTHKPERSHQGWPSQAVDQGAKEGSYKTFFPPPELAHSSTGSLVSHQIARTFRTGRTHSQNPHPGTALAKNWFLLRSKPWSRSSTSHKEEQGKSNQPQKQNLYTNTLFLGAGVRYTFRSWASKVLLIQIPHVHESQKQKKGRTLFVSSSGCKAIWCKQIWVKTLGNHPMGTSVMQISA
jgi:hypothetical protein